MYIHVFNSLKNTKIYLPCIKSSLVYEQENRISDKAGIFISCSVPPLNRPLLTVRRFGQLQTVEVVDLGTAAAVTHHQLSTLTTAETLIIMLFLPVHLLFISLPFLLLVLFLAFSHWSSHSRLKEDQCFTVCLMAGNR